MTHGVWMRAAAVAAVVACAAGESTARADQIRHPSGFTFALPKLGKAWAQEPRGDLLYVADDSDTIPELQMLVFPVKREGAAAEIVGRLPAELVRPGAELVTGAIKSAKVVGGTTASTVADASVVSGELLIGGGDKAVFAVVQRGGHSLVLVGVPKDGIYERGVSNFRAIVQGLQPGKPDGKAAPVAAKPAPPSAPTPMPKLPDLVGIREVTATSTFASKGDLYAPWRTVLYDAVLDKASGEYFPTTAWCEGKADEGVGESVTIAFASPTQLDSINIAAGVWKSAKLFASNNHVTTLDVALDGKSTLVKPTAKRAWLAVPIGRAVSTITVKIAGVEKGAMNDTCLSGISLQRKTDFTAIVGVDKAAVDGLPRALAAIQAALEADGHAGLDKLLDFPFSLHPAAGAFEGAPKAVKYATYAAVAAACRDEAKPLACPGPTNVDARDDRAATLGSAELATVEIAFPSHREVQDLWRLRWHDGAWHLAAIDYK